MRYLSICSGIEAASVAWHGLGWRPVGFSEIEAFPSAVLAQRWPSVPNFGDMTRFEEWDVGSEPVDLLVGGTPCQAFSVAGLRRGLSDARGNLSLVFCEMADHFDPRWVLWENVPGVLSSKDNAFGCFLAGLSGAGEPLVSERGWDNAGVVAGPKRTVAWRIFDAQYFGVAQRRRRVFVLAVRGAGDWSSAAALFSVGDGLHWDSPPSRQARKGTTGSVAPGVDSGRWWDGGDVAATLTKQNANGAQRMPDKDNFGAVLQPIPYDLYQITAPVNRQNRKPGDPCHTLARDNAAHAAVAIGLDEEQNACVEGFGTLKARMEGGGFEGSVMTTAMQVRRLTPVECERLQGFPDGYTNIPWRGKPESPDGPRYKALGNSMAVPVMRWIGERIQLMERINMKDKA